MGIFIFFVGVAVMVSGSFTGAVSPIGDALALRAVWRFVVPKMPPV